MKRFVAALAAALALAATAAAQGRVEVRLEAGSAYSHTRWMGPVPMKLTPQIAIWIETADGRFVDTIYVTRRSAQSSWRGGANIRRPEALPIWSHARGVVAADGLYMPDRGHPLPDAVSGATPTGSFAKTWIVPADLAPGAYRIRAELNASFDYNEAYPDKLPASDPRNSGANGQPSILWEADIQIGPAPASVELKVLGTGSLRGSDGAVATGLAGITSARAIASGITASYTPSR